MIPKRPTTRPVLLTQSSSFLTRIKKTFTKNNNSQEALVEHKEETLIDQLATDVIKKKSDDEVLIPIDHSSSSSDVDDNEEDEALEQRLVRQVTEMFSRSMFIYSNTCGMR